MALPRSHQAAYTPSEIEFLAGEEDIIIIPTHSMPKLQFISVNIIYLCFFIQLAKSTIMERVELSYKLKPSRIGLVWSISATVKSKSTTLACTHVEKASYV